jgi:hypothetical protein
VSEPLAAVLTDGQRRHYTVLLAMLEETINEVEAMTEGRNAGGRLRHQTGVLPERLRTTAQPLLERVRSDVGALARLLAVEPQEVSRVRRLQALLLSTIVRLEDSTSDKIRGYGEVDPGVARAVDPALHRIHGALENLAALVAPLAMR